MCRDIAGLASFAAARWGGATALGIPDAGYFTFRDIDGLAARCAGGLAARGLARGDRVVLHLPNGWQWIVAYHAIARLGAVVVPANILLSATEIRHMAADSGAVAIILADDRLAGLVGWAGIVVTPGGAAPSQRFGALLEAPPLAPAAVDPAELVTIGYTSGTTGTPKG